MRVGVDARLARVGLGIATFLGELVGALRDQPGVEPVWLGTSALAPEGVEVADPPGPFPVFDSPVGERWSRRLRLDVMHFAGNSGWPYRTRTPTVLTIHDLIWHSTPLRGRSARQGLGHAYLRLTVPRAARLAQAITTPSETTAADVVERLPGVVRPVAIRHGVEAPDVPPSTAVPRPYALAFSARDPRKGIEIALEGWRLSGVREQLVILAGAGLPEGFEEKVAPHVAEGRVRVLGYQPVEELWALLAGATALIYASQAEGFGLPVVEAMAAGTPVITGLAPVTLEIGGDAVVPLDPTAPAPSIARELVRLSEDEAFRDDVVRRGLERARLFDWSATAAAYAGVYRSVAR